MTERVDQASRLIQAPPSTIYQAFASARAMEAWLPPKGMTGQMLAFDFREGGFYRLCLTYNEPDPARAKSSDNTDEVEVRFLKLIADKRIEQMVAFESEKPEFAGSMKITWEFAAVDQKIKVTVRCENVPVGIQPEDHEAGLASTLENLAAFTE